MAGKMKKDAKDHIPYCDDQGMTNLAAAGNSGVAVQHLVEWPMSATGIVVFATVGLKDMVDGEYCVIIQNHTDAADEGTVSAAAKLTAQFTIAGPDTADVLDIVIVGRLKGQLA